MELLEHMQQHFKKNPISLHVPGHHYNTIGALNNLNLQYDVTEISNMDDYHHPEGIIQTSQQELTRGNYKGKYLINGTTVGIVSSVRSFIESGNTPSIAIMRNAHKSVYNALTIGKGSAYILPTEVSDVTGEYRGVLLDSIDEEKIGDVKLAVLTYPNYFGETYDIEAVIHYFHKRNIPILIDEAHGAHFDISNNFPCSSMNYGADIVVQSFHKTLPALTMSSVIYFNPSLVEQVDNITYYLTMLQSSSPSYLLMLGLDSANDFYMNYDDQIFIERRKQLIEALRKQFNVIESDDLLKVMISHDTLNGKACAEVLEDLNIYTELSNEKFALLVLPLWHEGDRYLFDELINRIDHIKLDSIDMIDKDKKNHSKIERSDNYNPHDGLFITQEKIGHIKICDLSESIGYKSAENLVPYPPGIPYILSGEIIRKEAIRYLQSFIKSGGTVHGITDGKIKVIE